MLRCKFPVLRTKYWYTSIDVESYYIDLCIDLRIVGWVYKKTFTCIHFVILTFSSLCGYNSTIHVIVDNVEHPGLRTAISIQDNMDVDWILNSHNNNKIILERCYIIFEDITYFVQLINCIEQSL